MKLSTEVCVPKKPRRPAQTRPDKQKQTQNTEVERGNTCLSLFLLPQKAPALFIHSSAVLRVPFLLRRLRHHSEAHSAFAVLRLPPSRLRPMGRRNGHNGIQPLNAIAYLHRLVSTADARGQHRPPLTYKQRLQTNRSRVIPSHFCQHILGSEQATELFSHLIAPVSHKPA